jgi:hypothetical protein
LRGVQYLAVVVVTVLASLSGGCETTLPNIERYDAGIDAGISKYHKDVVKFVRDAEQNKWPYAHAESRRFYSTAAADLSDIILRAEALAPSKKCITTELVAQGFTAIQAQMAANVAQINDTRIKNFVASMDVTKAQELSLGSCTVVVLKALKANNDILEAIHRKLNGLPPPASTISLEIISDTVRVALVNEVSKKR